MAQAPGTVSKILWHFTGGPKWNSTKNRQGKRRKPVEEAYQALLSILGTRELRLGEYREVVRVRVPRQRQRDERTGRYRIVRNVTIDLQSSPVCCLSDIPVAHLSYQERRYGKMAIGFHRKAVVRHGFTPVFYTLHHTHVLQSIYKSFQELIDVDASEIDSLASDLESETSYAQCEYGHEVEVDIASQVSDIQSAAQNIEEAVSTAKDELQKFLAFVKSFGPREFSTIYCEREWRSTQVFSFSESDLAMIVLPRASARRSYFGDFVRNRVRRLGIPRSIPVVPWEDLIEH